MRSGFRKTQKEKKGSDINDDTINCVAAKPRKKSQRREDDRTAGESVSDMGTFTTPRNRTIQNKEVRADERDLTIDDDHTLPPPSRPLPTTEPADQVQGGIPLLLQEPSGLGKVPQSPGDPAEVQLALLVDHAEDQLGMGPQTGLMGCAAGTAGAVGAAGGTDGCDEVLAVERQEVPEARLRHDKCESVHVKCS